MRWDFKLTNIDEGSRHIACVKSELAKEVSNWPADRVLFACSLKAKRTLMLLYTAGDNKA